MENLELWNKVCETDPAITKKAKISGKTITAICPQTQRKAATEQFGPFGIGWGVINEVWDYLDIGDTKLCHYTAIFWYVLKSSTAQNPRGEFPINANVNVAYMTQGYDNKPGYLKVDDEFAKKVQTNAITKGLSALGFNSDVFEGKFDDNKYVQEQKAKHRQQGSGNQRQPTPQQATKGHKIFLETMEGHCKALGNTEYMAVLGKEGYSDVNEIAPDNEAAQKRVHLAMKDAAVPY